MSSLKQKRKILVPIFNRAHFGRLRPVLSAVQNHPELELQIMVGTPAAYDYFWQNIKHSRPMSWIKTLPWYIRARLLGFLGSGAVLKNHFLSRALIESGFQIQSRIPIFFDGGISETMAKSVGFGFTKIVDELKRLKPDIVFVNADRFEMMAVTLAAAYLNIPIAHNEAGDVSGTIDESVRHAITKLAHIHFCSTEISRKRVIQMGENPDLVFTVGSPAIDVACNIDIQKPLKIIPSFNIKKPYLLALLHPVATENREANREAAGNLISVIKELSVPTILVGSNIDAMSSEVGGAIKGWQKQNHDSAIIYAKNLPPDDFYALLANASCAVGNSSSFIREGAYFGTPAVLIGSRQQGREKDANTLAVGIKSDEIKKGIAHQLKLGRYPKSLRFGHGQSANKIAEILAKTQIEIQKKFRDVT